MQTPASDLTSFLYEEARGYLEVQFTTIRDLEEKAGQIIRYNAVAAGIVVAALSVLATTGFRPQPRPLVVAAAVAGLVLLVLSMTLAALAFRRSRIAVGLDADRIEAALSLTEQDPHYLEDAVRAYLAGIRHNNRFVIARSDRVVAWSLGLLVGAAVAFVVLAIALIVSGGL